jgi:hypothetical protein
MKIAAFGPIIFTSGAAVVVKPVTREGSWGGIRKFAL